MAHASQVTTVDRPIAEVFAFLADGLNDPKWRPDVTSISQHRQPRGRDGRLTSRPWT